MSGRSDEEIAGNIIVSKWAESFKDFPPIQAPNSFTIDEALAMLSEAATGGKQ